MLGVCLVMSELVTHDVGTFITEEQVVLTKNLARVVLFTQHSCHSTMLSTGIHPKQLFLYQIFFMKLSRFDYSCQAISMLC